MRRPLSCKPREQANDVKFLFCAVLTIELAVRGYSQSGEASYWDRVYSAANPIFVQHPTALLVDAVRDRRPGKALDIGMGQGRNALFLAGKGWDVTGFDPSPEGVRLAKEQAAALHLPLRAVVAREQDFDFGGAQWDLIVMTYVRRVSAADAERFRKALKPEGMFVYENNNAGPRNELVRGFLQFRIQRFEDVEAIADWHPARRTRVERLIAVNAAR